MLCPRGRVGSTPTTGTRAARDEAEPSRPTQLKKQTWRYIIARTVREFGFHDLPDAAAALTYYAAVAIFPALIAVVAGFVMFGEGGNAIKALLSGAENTFPGVSTGSLRDAVDDLASSSGWLPLLIGLALTVWTVSRYIAGFSRAMNRIYGVDEGRPFRILKPQQLLVSIGFILIAGLMSIPLVVSGKIATGIGDDLGVGQPWLSVWEIGKWPVEALLGILLIGLLYYATPNLRQRRFRWLSFGAAIALVTMLVSSGLFLIYAIWFSDYDRFYRSLAGALILLVWLWIVNLALLFGAEADAQIERGRQLQAGIAAEDELQLEPRDTRLSQKRARLREELRGGAVAIRHDAAPRSSSKRPQL